MAEPLLARSIAAIVDLISITLSIIATLYSSAYNNERVLRGNRQAGDEFDQLAKCLRLLSDHKQPSRTQLKALSEREQVACWTLLQQTPSAAACLPPSFRDMTYIPDSVALARYMHRITAHCQEQTRHTPVFWRLQSWIPVSCALYRQETILTQCSRKPLRAACHRLCATGSQDSRWSVRSHMACC